MALLPIQLVQRYLALNKVAVCILSGDLLLFRRKWSNLPRPFEERQVFRAALGVNRKSLAGEMRVSCQEHRLTEQGQFPHCTKNGDAQIDHSKDRERIDAGVMPKNFDVLRERGELSLDEIVRSVEAALGTLSWMNPHQPVYACDADHFP